MLVEKLTQLLGDMDKPCSEISPTQLTAQVMELVAIAEREGDVPPEAFATLPPEVRVGAFSLAMGVVLHALK